jgi:BNR repeat-containing family member
MITQNRKAAGFGGTWYMNGPSGDEYAYKYSGGLGTYCMKHIPFAVYRPEVDKTFFCWGGMDDSALDHNIEAMRTGKPPEDWDPTGLLLHCVAAYDHATDTVSRPTIVLDKMTFDAHDNPVISVDAKGYIWIFSTSHGTGRPSYIHRSVRPYDVNDFELVEPVADRPEGELAITNFSYMQVFHDGERFHYFFTRYNEPADRTLFYANSVDGLRWENWASLAGIELGHYQVSNICGGRAATAFNMHPHRDEGHGLNWRSNLYYMESRDNGKSWQAADGAPLQLPLTEIESPALVHDYQAEGLNVYMKDIAFDGDDRPVILYVTSKGYESGPGNGPRQWTTARWTGEEWTIRPAMTSDNNYDSGSLIIDADGAWRIMAPTEPGPQPYNPGGEVALWISHDQGATWEKARAMTANSSRNHTYVRRVVNAHPGFVALWADGHARQPSISNLYFADADGNVRLLPREMDGDAATPETVNGC